MDDFSKTRSCSFLVQISHAKYRSMNKLTLSFATIAALIIFTSQAYANACSSRARQLASSMNATVISVQTAQGSGGQSVCVAKFQISSKGKPSRIVTKKFRP